MTDSAIITSREGNAEDCGLVHELLQRAFGEYRGVIQPESSVLKETVGTLQSRLETQILFVARYQDAGAEQIAGCVFCYPKEDLLYFGRLAVSAAYRGSGIASALIGQVEEKAIRDGYSKVSLEVRISLPKNIAFFESLGYEITGSFAHNGYEYPTYYAMEKELIHK